MQGLFFDRRLLANFDWLLLLLVLLIASCGIVVIYSASGTGTVAANLYLKQINWILYGLVAMTMVIIIDYHTIERFAYILYIGIVILLLIVMFYGKKVSGAQRWISLGFMNFQPSELSKFIIVIVLARYFDDKRDAGLYRFRDLIVPTIMVFIPFYLIAKQPDLGTGIIFISIFAAICLIVGIHSRSLLFFGILTVISAPLFWFLLKGYQKIRILTLINPKLDPLGAGYHTIQSKIAIGSGGLLGKGLLSGTQSQLNFLPEKHTDFIFAVFCEEMGFVGVFIFLFIFLTLILKGIDIIYQAKDMSGLLMATGCVAIFGTHVIINIAMTVGLFPIVGIPLPLMSYGGSFMLTSFLTIGLLLNIHMRRFQQKR